MQAASRESYAAAAERLDALRRRAREPSAVAARRRRDPRRRRPAARASRGCAGRWPTRPAPARDRAGLLGALLDGKVGADALEPARARWSPAAGRAPARPARRHRAARRRGAAGQRRLGRRAGRGRGRAVPVRPGRRRRPAARRRARRRRSRRWRSGPTLVRDAARRARPTPATVAAGRSWPCAASAGAASRLADPAGRARRRAAGPPGRLRDRGGAAHRGRGAPAGRPPAAMYGRQITLKITVDPAILGGMQRPDWTRPVRRHGRCAGSPRPATRSPGATMPTRPTLPTDSEPTET